MTIQSKTALLFTVVTGSIILMLSIAIYFFVSRSVSNDFLKRLELRTVIAHRLKFEQDRTSVDVYDQLRKQYLESLPRQTGYMLSFDSSGSQLIQQSGLSLPETYYQAIIAANGETTYYRKGNLHYAGQLYRDKTGKFIFITSAVNDYGLYLLSNLKKVLLLTFVGSVILVFTISIFFSRTTFQPVRSIINRVKDISAHNLHLRLESKVSKDEITELANTFNNMLDRLQTAFETQNNFVGNASHELRTPLTAISGETELALSRERTAEEYRQSLSLIAAQADKLKQLTRSLLQLAQSGFDGKKQSWEDVRVDELLYQVKASVDQIDAKNQLDFQVASWPVDANAITTYGNAQLLQLAFSNIALNACKYSDDKKVMIELYWADDEIRVEIVDQGIGIPADELSHIYDPFFRASNTNQYEGYGVGLPLARAIIRLHEGNIQVLSEEGKGTRVVIQLLPLKRFSTTG